MRRSLAIGLLVGLVFLSGCAGAGALFGEAEWGVTDVTEETNFDYTGVASGVGNGDSGVYVADYDNDDWPDVLAIGGRQPILFHNNEGTFEQSDALPDISGQVQGALFFDANGNGLEDLLILKRDGQAVFLRNNDGDFSRESVGLEIELSVPVGGTAADYDQDGDLDVFITQYGDWADGSPEGYFNHSGFIANDNGNPNYLFENTDDGFERVENAGITGEHWSLTASFVDLNGNGLPDVHVANDFNNDTFYINQGDGTFERRVMPTQTARNGMSSEIVDFNVDGKPDIFVTNIFFPLDEYNLTEEKRERLRLYFDFVLRSKRIEGNNLMINSGKDSFSFEGDRYGVKSGGWGWAAVATDLDNDGTRDLFHTTQNLIRLDDEDPHFTYPMVWLRGPDGFENLDTSERGFLETDGRGAVELDYDRDGDMDLIISTYDDAFKIYENNADTLADSNSLQLDIVDEAGSPGLGATVAVTIGDTTKYDVLNAKADYQSQDTRTLHFGLGDADTVDKISITWSDGSEVTVTDIDANQRITIRPNGAVDKTDYE